MLFKPVFLATDIAFFAILVLFALGIRHSLHTPDLRAKWARVFAYPQAAAAAVVMAACMLIAVLDSLHFRPALAAVANSKTKTYSPETLSVLDLILATPKAAKEKSYSEPFASVGLLKETRKLKGQSVRDYPPLVHAGKAYRAAQPEGALPAAALWRDLALRALRGVFWGGLLAALCIGIVSAVRAQANTPKPSVWAQRNGHWGVVTLIALCVSAAVLWQWAQAWHVLGTDRAGGDVFYATVKSIRTAVVIGLITTLASLPFALVLGLAAGYLRGWVDEVIQYAYTVLSSIPGVLLIAALVLMIQVWIDANTALFPTALQRADIKLFLLCIVLGLTSWAGLARLMRGEAMRLREMEYVAAAQAFGVPAWRVMARHLLPNVMHLVVLSVTLEFSGLVLYEAVLSYIGVGVDPSIQSFGGMIDVGRSELARTPVIWWPLSAAFVVMLMMVLAVNVFADCVQTAFDPRNAGHTSASVGGGQ